MWSDIGSTGKQRDLGIWLISSVVKEMRWKGTARSWRRCQSLLYYRSCVSHENPSFFQICETVTGIICQPPIVVETLIQNFEVWLTSTFQNVNRFQTNRMCIVPQLYLGFTHYPKSVFIKRTSPRLIIVSTTWQSRRNLAGYSPFFT